MRKKNITRFTITGGIKMDKKLQDLSWNYFQEIIKNFPPMATISGIHEYDGEMPDGSIEAEERFKKIRKKFHADVREIDPDSLTAEGRIDRGAVLNSVGVQIFEDDAHGRLYSQPTVGMVIGAALHSLFTKDFAPFEYRFDKIAQRLNKTPSYLNNSKTVLKDPVKIWVEMAAEESESLTGFITLIQKTAQEKDISEKTLNRLNDAAEKAKNSLNEYAQWLTGEVVPKSREDFAMKPEDFDRLMELRELGYNSDELIEFGRRMLDESRERRRKVCRDIDPSLSVEEIRKMMQKNHPETFEEVLRLTNEAVEKSRKFVVESGFATVPEGEKLLVVETPSFARSFVPFGAYMPPGRFEKKQEGVYWMSRPFKDKGQSMDIHNKGAILNTSVHEGYPGHHLQLVCGNTNKSKARLLTSGTEFVEGWAHYCEEKVGQMGFSTEPEVMFERTVDMIWRAIRIIVDVKLSRGEISFDRAVDILQKESGFDRHSCISEVKRYTFTPGYQLSYLLGKKMIMDLLNKIKKNIGPLFDLRKFHDAMLYAGILPMKYMEMVVENAFVKREAAIG